MITGIVSRIQGKLKVATLIIGKGGIVDGSSEIAGRVLTAQRLALAVTAVANTDFTMSIPPGASIQAFRIYTTTAFTAVTDAQLSVGAAAGGQDYVALTTIKALGVYNPSFVGAGAAALASALAASPNLFIRIVQTGGSTAVGAATLLVNYVLP